MTGQLVLDNGLPVPHAEVAVTTNGWTEVADPVLTDAQGRFVFTGLPEGQFILTAHRNDLGSFYWGRKPQPGEVSVLKLNEKLPHQDILFRVERFGTIVGTVRDPAGNPAPNMQVSAARRSWGNGKAAMQIASNGMSDDQGRFRIPLLSRGRYRICATSLGGEPVLPVGNATFGQRSREVYAETCLPGAQSSKALLQITPGQELELDLVLNPQASAEVSGIVSNPPEGQNVSVQLQAMEQSSGGPILFGQTAGETHTFQIANVVPGRYWVTARASRNDNGVETLLGARVPLNVGDAGAKGVELTLEPLPAINVVIHAPQDAGVINVGLRDADEPFGGATDAAKQPDGSLRIALQHSGRYRLVTRTNLCPSSAHLGKVDAEEHALEIPPGTQETLELSFTKECGELLGTAVDQAGNPVPGARNLILLSGTPDDPGDLMLGTAELDGSFLYYGLKPGKYPLWAWNDSEEWNGSVEDLGVLKARQTVIEIKAGEKTAVQLPLLNTFRQGNK